MYISMINGSSMMAPILAITQWTWGIIGVGAVLAFVIVAMVFYMLGSHSERH